MTTIIDTLRALSTDSVTVTATMRDGRMIVTTKALTDDLEAWQAEIAEVLKPAGYAFSDAGGEGDGSGIYEVWRPVAATRPVAETAESTYIVEGCGPDQTLTAETAEAAAQEAAEWQHGFDGLHTVTLRWRDAGSDATTVAVYDCEVDGESVGRVTVRAA